MLHASIDSTPRGHVGHYRLVAKIGAGGQASVYRATRGDGDCAVKVFHGSMSDDGARRRFRAECTALAELDDVPEVVGLLDHGEVDGHGFIVMPLFETSYAARLGSLGRLAVDEVLASGRAIARALTAVHARGFLHLDVKPSNVFLDGVGHVVLGDFGTSRDRVEHTITGSLASSLPYAAPELLDRSITSVSTDLYALGATLYELLTGRPPFGAPVGATDTVDVAGLGALVRQIETRPPPPIEVEGVPEPLIRLIADLLDKDATRRPSSAAVVTDRLRRIDTSSVERRIPPGANAVTRPPTAPSRDRRRPRRLAAAGTVAAVALAGMALWVGARREQPISLGVATSDVPVSVTAEPQRPVFVAAGSTTSAPARTPTDEPTAATSTGPATMTTATSSADERREPRSLGPPASTPTESTDDPGPDGAEQSDPLPPRPDAAVVPSAQPTDADVDGSEPSPPVVPVSAPTTTPPARSDDPRPAEPVGPCGGAEVVVCDGFEEPLVGWTQRESGSTTVERAASAGRLGSDGVAVRTTATGFGSAALRRPVVVDGDTVSVSAWMRFDAAQARGEWFANVLALVDERDSLWNLDIRGTDAGMVLSLYHQTTDGFTAGGSVETPLDSDRWYCVGLVVAPGSDEPAVLTVDGATVVQVTDELSTPIGAVYTLTVGSNYISDQGLAPDLFYDDVNVTVDAAASC